MDPETESLRRVARELRQQRHLSAAIELERIPESKEEGKADGESGTER